MIFQLKHKLLLLWMCSILLVLAPVPILFSAALTRWHQVDAKAQLRAGFTRLAQDLDARRQSLLKHAQQFAAHKDLETTLTLFDDTHGSQHRFDAEKSKVAGYLREFAYTSGVEMLAVYDLNLHLNSFYYAQVGGMGYASYRDGFFTAYNFLPGMDDQEIILPPILSAHPPMLPDAPEFSVEGGGYGMMLVLDIPFVRNFSNGQSQPYAILRLGDSLNEQFALSFMHRTGLKFEFGMKHGIHFGEKLGLGKPVFDTLPQLTGSGLPENAADWLLIDEHWFSARAALPLTAEDPLLFVLATPRPRLHPGLSALTEVLFWIALSVLVVMTPLFLYFLQRHVSRPLLQLAQDIDAVAGARPAQQTILRSVELDGIRFALETLSASLQAREERLNKLGLVVEQSPTAVMITDDEGCIEYVNARFTQTSGYTLDEIRGRNPRFLRSGYMSRSVYERLWKTLREGRGWHGEMYNRKKDGTFFWEAMQVLPFKDKQGETTHFIALKEDISLRKEYEKQLNRQSSYDPLTNLPNRGLANDRLSQALAMAHRTGRQVALMFIDLDNFKKINDTLGHQAGDTLLVEIATRLRKELWEEDTLARQGGDEFLVILPNLENATMAESIAQKLLTCFTKPVQMDDREIFVTASLGIAVAPNDGDEAPILMRNADAAMYQAKEAGRNTYRFFAPAMNVQALKRLEMESRLQRALEREELLVYYQAQVDAHSGAVLGAEALLRWHNPKLGTVSPELFIPLAENSGMIEVIGAWVLRCACLEAMHWHFRHDLPLRMAVNVSANQFRSPHFFDTVAQVLKETGLPPYLLELELTESILMESDTDTGALLSELKSLGLTLALDDFGTGYSSLLYLKRFPFDLLKIDRSFVQGIPEESDSTALTVAIINMAHSLGLKVIAEGVENEDQEAFLQSHRCDILQGYYFSKPISSKDFAAFIQSKIDCGEMTAMHG